MLLNRLVNVILLEPNLHYLFLTFALGLFTVNVIAQEKTLINGYWVAHFGKEDKLLLQKGN